MVINVNIFLVELIFSSSIFQISSTLECVTPRIRCARFPPDIRRRCHVICLCVAFYYVIMCISFCIGVRLMHPSIFSVVRFAIRRSYALRCSPFVSRCERVLNVLRMDRVLPSGLGIALVGRLSSFVPFGGRLVLQRLTELARKPLSPCSPTPLQSGPKPI